MNRKQVKDIHKGFAIVIASQYNRYGKYAYVYNVEPTRELADNSKASFERCDGIRYKVVDCNEIQDSRADMLEATVMHIANELYKKKDKFGLGLSQKDLDEIIYNLNSSPVFKRLVEQEVRNWIKEQDDLNV